MLMVPMWKGERADLRRFGTDMLTLTLRPRGNGYGTENLDFSFPNL